MKILYLTDNLIGTSGWSRYSIDITNAIKELGHEIKVLPLGEPLRYLKNPLFCWFKSRPISFQIKKFKPDIVHFLVEPYVGMLPYLKVNKSCVTLHGTYALKTFQGNSLADSIDGFVAVSHYTADKFKTAIGPQHSVQVITNGIDVSSGQKKTGENRTTENILFVGQIKPRKGVINLIAALNAYYKKYSNNFRADIVGQYDGKSQYGRQIKDLIKDYNLSGNVFLHGEVSPESLGRYYQKAGLFIMLPIEVNNEFEGFGLVYLEAAIYGIPCIGSVNSGAEDAIVNNKTGYLVDPYNLQEAASAIDKILNKEAIKSEDCQKWAQENDINKKAAEIISFYSRLNTS